MGPTITTFWLWFQLGIVGLASYLMLIRQILITARRAAGVASEETARYLVAFIFGIIGVSGALIFAQLFEPWLYIWIYVGVTMRMAVIAMQTVKQNALDEQRDAAALASSAAATAAHRIESRLPATRRGR